MRWMLLLAFLGCRAVDTKDTDEPAPETDSPADTVPDEETDTPEETDIPEETDPPEDTSPPVDTSPPADPCFVDPATLTIGTGEEAFEALVPEQNLEMVLGPQGGWHITLSFLATNVLETVTLEIAMTDVETGVVVSSDTLNSFLYTDNPPWACDGSLINYQSVLSSDTIVDGVEGDPPEVLCGRRVEVTVDLKVPTFVDNPLAGETLASDSVFFIVQPDAASGEYCTTP